MKEKNQLSVSDIVDRLFANGSTPLKQYGINEDLIKRVESENPHVAKQYPWQGPSVKVA